MSRGRPATRKVELVETDNIAKALKRVEDTPGGDWKRALYHALAMSGVWRSHEQIARIREALELP